MALISLSDFTARYEGSLSAEEQTRVTNLITDASALVVQAVGNTTVTDAWDNGNAPAAVVPVVVNMVRRALVNPDQVESETVGGYTWRGRAIGIFMTRDERHAVRSAAGLSTAGSIDQQGHFPTHSSLLVGTWLDGAL